MKRFLLIAAVLTMATACNSKVNETSWSKTISGDMTTTNAESGEDFVDTANVIIATSDITKPFLNINIEGVRFVAMMPEVNFELANVPFKLYPSDDRNDPLYGSWAVAEDAIVPTVGGVSREEYTLYNFRASIFDDGVTLDFDVNFGGVIFHARFGKNETLQSWEAEFNASATIAINPGEQAMTSTDDLKVLFFQPNLSKQVATITFKDIRFVAMMPEITFVLKDVPFSYSEDGSSRLFNVATVVPTINNAPMEQYTITQLRGTVTNSAMLLDFKMEQMNASVSISGY